jgi:hypothetical protein
MWSTPSTVMASRKKDDSEILTPSQLSRYMGNLVMLLCTSNAYSINSHSHIHTKDALKLSWRGFTSGPVRSCLVRFSYPTEESRGRERSDFKTRPACLGCTTAPLHHCTTAPMQPMQPMHVRVLLDGRARLPSQLPTPLDLLLLFSVLAAVRMFLQDGTVDGVHTAGRPS